MVRVQQPQSRDSICLLVDTHWDDESGLVHSRLLGTSDGGHRRWSCDRAGYRRRKLWRGVEIADRESSHKDCVKPSSENLVKIEETVQVGSLPRTNKSYLKIRYLRSPGRGSALCQLIRRPADTGVSVDVPAYYGQHAAWNITTPLPSPLKARCSPSIASLSIQCCDSLNLGASHKARGTETGTEISTKVSCLQVLRISIR